MGEKKKVCRKCNLELSISMFGKDLDRVDGLKRQCKICLCKCSKQWREKHPEYRAKHAESQRKSSYVKFGITAKEFEQYVEKLGSKCEICGEVRVLRLDHNHETMRFRGALCHRDNVELGHYELGEPAFRFNRFLLKAVVAYLNRENKPFV